jgi:error-prone DNA polymerase
MKCHHADVFACALLNAWPMGFYSPATILGDARRHGVAIRPACLRHSAWDCTLEENQGRPRFALRIGLRYIKGLVRTEADRLLAVRGIGEGPLLAEWKARARVSSETWEKLAVSGALEDFGIHRRQALWDVLDSGGPDSLPLDDGIVAEFPQPTALEAVEWDYQAMGHSPQSHITAPFRSHLRRNGYRTAVEVAELEPSGPIRYAGLVTCRQRPGNAKGVLFLTLEDETGMVNVVVWEKVWNRFRRVILTSSFLGVEGKLQKEDSVVHLIADRLWAPEGLPNLAEIARQSHDFH